MYYLSYFLSIRRPPRKNEICFALFPELLSTYVDLGGLPLLELLLIR